MISNGKFCPVAVFNGAQIALLKNDPTFFENFQKKFFSIFFIVLNYRESHNNHIKIPIAII